MALRVRNFAEEGIISRGGKLSATRGHWEWATYRVDC